ncbi:PEP-utilizing enzyme [Streptomyces sp. NBC_00669]|uniref:putative PEP-binding protein n=1 Tax=Streptomyces sp. NBC_00669 TaxID=2976011 RepID=UPI002E324D31|nr:putative PEP-binding protein [Streptomyces sp. NBC_00669]
MSTRLRYPGQPASPGTALGELHRTDRPFPTPTPTLTRVPRQPADAGTGTGTAYGPGGTAANTAAEGAECGCGPGDPAAEGSGEPAISGRADASSGTPASASAPAGPSGPRRLAALPAPADAGETAVAPEAGGLVADAFDTAADRLHAVAAGLRARGDEEQADIIEIGGLIARDPDLRQHALRLVAGGADPADAVHEAVDAQARAIAALGDPVLAERAADVRQVGRRVLAVLHGVQEPPPDRPVVLAAREIGAADLLEPGRTVTAALSVTGGPNSHAAIVARSLGIPLLLGVDPLVLDLPDGVETLVDGAAAVVHPAAGERESALAAIAAVRERRARLAAERHLPARTVDGHPVTLRANVATPADVRAGLLAGADGVGLLRTELPFLDAVRWPSRARHTIALGPVLAPLAGRIATVRTLDFADDKLPPFLSADRPAGRGIGRGLPLMLARPHAFGEQFTALLAAAAGARAELRIMIPMVADVGELRACRALLDRAAAELDLPAPPLGIMVELPEAVRRIDELAREAAFLSLGTNDLTCQLLELDRRDPAAGPASTAHPAVLRAIAAVVAAARTHRRPVSVCGDAAAHPLVLPLLVGLGCDTLSVAPSALDEVRAAVRRLDHTSCREAAAEALVLRTAEQVHHLVRCRLPALPD